MYDKAVAWGRRTEFCDCIQFGGEQIPVPSRLRSASCGAPVDVEILRSLSRPNGIPKVIIVNDLLDGCARFVFVTFPVSLLTGVRTVKGEFAFRAHLQWAILLGPKPRLQAFCICTTRSKVFLILPPLLEFCCLHKCTTALRVLARLVDLPAFACVALFRCDFEIEGFRVVWQVLVLDWPAQHHGREGMDNLCPYIQLLAQKTCTE